jgi:hypothetical protein
MVTKREKGELVSSIFMVTRVYGIRQEAGSKMHQQNDRNLAQASSNLIRQPSFVGGSGIPSFREK